MNSASTRRAVAIWRRLILLLPAVCLIPLGVLAFVAAGAARLPASSGWRTFWFEVLLLFAGWEALYLAAGVAAAVLARRGADLAALVVLAAVWAAALSVVGPLDWCHLSSSSGESWGFSLVLAMPVIVAAGLAVAGLPLVRGGATIVRFAVIVLLAVPMVRFLGGFSTHC